MGITRKIALAAGLLGVLSGLILGLVTLLLESRSQIDFARLNADRILKATLPQIESAYWEVDVPAVRAIMSGLLEDPVIELVRIEDPLLTDDMRATTGLDDLTAADPERGPMSWPTRVFAGQNQAPEVHAYALSNPRDGAEIGQLTAELSFRSVYESLVGRSFVVFGTSILQTMFVTTVIFLVVQITVIRPISHLQSAALRVRDGHSFELKGRDRRMFDRTRRDEISRLARAFRRTVTELEASRDNLQSVVDDRTRELVEARNEAVEASQAKSVFLANMSHELRTPLNAISGLSEILLREGQDRQSLRHLSDMRAAAAQLGQNIDSVLDLSKIEAGELVLEQVWVGVDDLLDDVLSQTRALLLDQPTGLSWSYDPELPDQIRTDPLRMRQILINFASNAVKFTPNGSIRFEVSCDRRADGKSELVFSVEDTGIGISPEQLPEVFKPFGQADSSTTRQFGGTGLGLPIVQRLADLMGGEMIVDSELGSGSRFSLKIELEERRDARDAPPASSVRLVDLGGPVRQIRDLALRTGHQVVDVEADAEIQVDKDHIEVRRANAAELAGNRIDLPITHREFSGVLDIGAGSTEETDATERVLQGREVLVVEDNRINRSVFVALIEAMGAQVRTAENGLEAIGQVQGRMPDILLMDLHMPLMDGHSALAGLRKAHGDTLAPVIATSANATPEENRRCMAAGFASFLPKPVDPDRLAEVLLVNIGPEYKPAGLDTKRGLLFAGQDRELYAGNLERFRTSLQKWDQQLACLTEDPQPEKQARLFHVMKGVAGTVGASELESKVRLAERQEVSLTDVLESVRETAEALNENNAVNGMKARLPLNPEALKTLADMVRNHDLGALAQVRRHLAGPGPVSDTLSALEQALIRLDFGEAQTCVDRLARDVA